MKLRKSETLVFDPIQNLFANLRIESDAILIGIKGNFLVSGFAALLSGYRDPDEAFDQFGWIGAYWSGTEEDTHKAWSYLFFSNLGETYGYGELQRYSLDKSSGFSCRCIQNVPSDGID